MIRFASIPNLRFLPNLKTRLRWFPVPKFRVGSLGFKNNKNFDLTKINQKSLNFNVFSLFFIKFWSILIKFCCFWISFRRHSDPSRVDVRNRRSVLRYPVYPCRVPPCKNTFWCCKEAWKMGIRKTSQGTQRT